MQTNVRNIVWSLGVVTLTLASYGVASAASIDSTSTGSSTSNVVKYSNSTQQVTSSTEHITASDTSSPTSPTSSETNDTSQAPTAALSSSALSKTPSDLTTALSTTNNDKVTGTSAPTGVQTTVEGAAVVTETAPVGALIATPIPYTQPATIVSASSGLLVARGVMVATLSEHLTGAAPVSASTHPAPAAPAAPRPLDLPTLPAMLLQQLGAMANLALILAPLHQIQAIVPTSSWIQMSAPSTVPLLAASLLLLVVGSLFVLRLRAAGFSVAPRGIPAVSSVFNLITSRTMSLETELVSARGSFFSGVLNQNPNYSLYGKEVK